MCGVSQRGVETAKDEEGGVINTGLMSSAEYRWTTPQDFFEELDAEFRFTLDPCAEPHTAKCDKFFTLQENGLAQNWQSETVFCNPPYGREIPRWVEKCYHEGQKPDTTVVMLIPARTDTRWFHEFIYGIAEIRFIKGRLYFGDGTGRAPFPSMVVIYQ